MFLGKLSANEIRMQASNVARFRLVCAAKSHRSYSIKPRTTHLHTARQSRFLTSCVCNNNSNSHLTHVDKQGKAVMVDVSDKNITKRIARAKGTVLLGKNCFDLVNQNNMKKGDILSVSQLDGVMGAYIYINPSLPHAYDRQGWCHFGT
eukprot:m.290079 g.290079  ORF g.290079 m.290079 type:complete len:149 (-) comp16377_c0_seq29:348-794(-)